METEELVLSDVHASKQVDESLCLQYSRFKFNFSGVKSNNKISSLKSKSELLFDEDGDVVTPDGYQSVSDCDVVGIYHKMSTNLSSVGMQVWRGALLMCDCILHKKECFTNKHVLELGSGSGLTGIVVGQYAASLVCTDAEDDVLCLCQKNIDHNARFFKSSHIVSTVLLNWFDFESDFVKKLVHKPDVILACDCVYDNDLTDALLECIFNLLSLHDNQDEPIAILSMEKRLNFTVTDFDVTCHEYDYFKRRLFEMKNSGKITFEQINVESMPQYFEYDKVKQLELVEIKLM